MYFHGVLILSEAMLLRYNFITVLNVIFGASVEVNLVLSFIKSSIGSKSRKLVITMKDDDFSSAFP
jgi:hypothetical protein